MTKVLKLADMILIVGDHGKLRDKMLREVMGKLGANTHLAVAMSPVQSTRKLLREFIPDSLVYNQYVEDEIAKVLRIQDLKTNQREVAAPHRALVVLVDCGIPDRPTLRILSMNGRCFYIRLLVCCSASDLMLSQAPASILSQVDNVFCFKQRKTPSAVEFLYKRLLRIFKTQCDLEAALDATRRDCVLGVDNTTVNGDFFEHEIGKRQEPKLIGCGDLKMLQKQLLVKKTKKRNMIGDTSGILRDICNIAVLYDDELLLDEYLSSVS